MEKENSISWKGTPKQFNNFIELLELKYSPQDKLSYVIGDLNNGR